MYHWTSVKSFGVLLLVRNFVIVLFKVDLVYLMFSYRRIGGLRSRDYSQQRDWKSEEVTHQPRLARPHREGPCPRKPEAPRGLHVCLSLAFSAPHPVTRGVRFRLYRGFRQPARRFRDEYSRLSYSGAVGPRDLAASPRPQRAPYVRASPSASRARLEP